MLIGINNDKTSITNYINVDVIKKGNSLNNTNAFNDYLSNIG